MATSEKFTAEFNAQVKAKQEQYSNEASAELEKMLKAKGKNDLKEFDAHKESCIKAITDYNHEVKLEKYAEFLATENPLFTAVVTAEIPAKRYNENKDKDTGALIVEIQDTTAKVNLLDFCKMAGIEPKFKPIVSTLLNRFMVRGTEIMGMNDNDLYSNYCSIFVSIAKDVKEGKTVTSNTQFVKNLQDIVDAVEMRKDKNGYNIYRATNVDIAFLHNLVYKRDGKSKAGLKSVTEGEWLRCVQAVLYKIFTGEKYTVTNASLKWLQTAQK